MNVDLGQVISQAQFAEMVGLSEAKVSQMKADGLLLAGETGGQWLRSYVARLREQAAGRMGSDGGADLVTERALLTREQRIGQELKNARERGEYASISLLTDVLASASQAVVDRLEMITSTLRVKCPDLPQAALDTVMEVVTSARNEMARKTTSLAADLLADDDTPVEEEPPLIEADED